MSGPVLVLIDLFILLEVNSQREMLKEGTKYFSKIHDMISVVNLNCKV